MTDFSDLTKNELKLKWLRLCDVKYKMLSMCEQARRVIESFMHSDGSESESEWERCIKVNGTLKHWDDVEHCRVDIEAMYKDMIQVQKTMLLVEKQIKEEIAADPGNESDPDYEPRGITFDLICDMAEAAME